MACFKTFLSTKRTNKDTTSSATCRQSTLVPLYSMSSLLCTS
jgi:hypothetical protein